jgi:hypothetical protein
MSGWGWLYLGAETVAVLSAGAAIGYLVALYQRRR